MIPDISRILGVHSIDWYAADNVPINLMCKSTPKIITILARSNFTETFCKKSRSDLLKIVFYKIGTYHLCDQVLQEKKYDLHNCDRMEFTWIYLNCQKSGHLELNNP
jgi:hypothetical protein